MSTLSPEARNEHRVQVIRLRKTGLMYDAIAAQTWLTRTGVFDICKSYMTEGAVAELIAHSFCVRLLVRTMGLHLSRWSFTPQKPIHNAYEQSSATVRQWLNTDYLVIAKRVKAEDAEIHLGEETGLRSDDARGRSFAPRGETPDVPINNKRKGLSIISSLINKEPMRWKIFEGTLNAGILIDFLWHLIKGTDMKMLILDNRRVHHSKPVKTSLVRHKDQIEVFYLQSYRPELNPYEMVNADLRQSVTSKTPARIQAQLAKLSSSHLPSILKKPARIRSYFQHNPVRYAAWSKFIGVGSIRMQ